MIACSVLNKKIENISDFIKNSRFISKYFKGVPRQQLYMSILFLKEKQDHKIKDFEKSLDSAFSYIDNFKMDIDSTYMYPNSKIGIKLLLRDESIFCIMSNLRNEAQTKYDINKNEVIFHVTLARCFKHIEEADVQNVNLEFLKLTDMTGKIEYIVLDKPKIII